MIKKQKVTVIWQMLPIWLKIAIPLSFVFNLISVTIFSFHISIVTMPPPDAGVSNAFNQASGSVVAINSFTYKINDKYYILVETTKEGKELLEKLEKK
ncbi:MAG: hypothetical protein NTY47_07065 [Candidatus Omnitrophica bacterium]|nr:hypothetical protein [Candidatus Omnitrophota bacterium]